MPALWFPLRSPGSQLGLKNTHRLIFRTNMKCCNWKDWVGSLFQCVFCLNPVKGIRWTTGDRSFKSVSRCHGLCIFIKTTSFWTLLVFSCTASMFCNVMAGLIFTYLWGTGRCWQVSSRRPKICREQTWKRGNTGLVRSKQRAAVSIFTKRKKSNISCAFSRV